MTTIEIRPRFQRLVAYPPQEVLGRLRRELDRPECDLIGAFFDHHVVLKIPYEEQHFWSPQLSMEVESEPDGQRALIRGLYGPRPSVWLMFIFFYSILGFISMIIMIIGFSQWNLGLSARILWILPVLFLILALVYFSARIGQRLGKEEMERLHHFLEKTLAGEIRE